MSAFGSKANLRYEDLTLPRPSDGSHLAAASAAAEERVAAVGLEARHADAGRHLDLLQHLAALRIDSTEFAFLGFPGAVPEFAVDPGDAGDEAVGLDGAQDLAGLRIDLMDLAVAMLPDPERSLPPRPCRRRRRRASGWWRRRGRSSDRPSGCDPRRSGTGVGRRRRFRHARGHRARAPSCRSPGRSRSACRRSRSRYWCRHS